MPSPHDESLSLCILLFYLLDYCNSLVIDINCDHMHRLQKVQNHAAKVVFMIMSMLDHCSSHFTGCQSKTGLFLRWPLLFSISLMVSDHHTCHHVFPVLMCVPVQMKKIFLVHGGILRALLPVILCSGFPCVEQPSCSHPTLQFSLTVQNFS